MSEVIKVALRALTFRVGVPLITLANLDIPNFDKNNIPEDLKNIVAIKPGSRPGT